MDVLGPKLQSFTFERSPDAVQDAATFNAIARSCGATITELSVTDYTPNVDDMMPFTALKKLSLFRVAPHNFRLITTLISLRLSYISRSIDGYGIGEMLTILLSENPRLQQLEIECSGSPLIFEIISLCTPYLTHLKVAAPYFDAFAAVYVHERIAHLGTLQNLRSIDLDLHCRLSLVSVINLFARNQIPVEKITMKLGQIRDIRRHNREEKLTLKSLKELRITIWTDDVCMGDLISVAKKQTSLERLTVESFRGLTLNVIEKILKFNKNIKQFSAFIVVLTIDMQSYESVLKLAKGRATVQLKIYDAKIYVPNDILAENKKWMDIEALKK